MFDTVKVKIRETELNVEQFAFGHQCIYVRTMCVLVMQFNSMQGWQNAYILQQNDHKVMRNLYIWYAIVS